MNRWLLIGLLTVAGTATAASYGVYSYLYGGQQPPAEKPPEPPPALAELPSQEEFDRLAKTDPVGMIAACLARYQKDGVTGFRATLDKQERVGGRLGDPEVLSVAVRQTPPAVAMHWLQTKSSTAATLYAEGENGNQIKVWRPTATLIKSMDVPAKSPAARAASRYCIVDAGLFKGMLRSHAAWSEAQKAGTLKVEYLGLGPVEKVGGRVCHQLKRTCVGLEADSFAQDEQKPTDPKVVERDGFNEVVLYIDAERWLQVGTEQRRKADGADDLVGAYYYRDVQLSPAFRPDEFTPAGLKAGPPKN